MRVRETTAQCNWVANKKVQQALLSCVVWRASVPAFRSRCLSHCHPPARAATAQTRGLTGGAGRPRFLSFLLGAGLSLLLPWKGWQGGATTLGGGRGVLRALPPPPSLPPSSQLPSPPLWCPCFAPYRRAGWPRVWRRVWAGATNGTLAPPPLLPLDGTHHCPLLGGAGLAAKAERSHPLPRPQPRPFGGGDSIACPFGLRCPHRHHTLWFLSASPAHPATFTQPDPSWRPARRKRRTHGTPPPPSGMACPLVPHTCVSFPSHVGATTHARLGSAVRVRPYG